MRERLIDFFVPGIPRPQGSAKWIRSPATGKSIPIKNKNLETWRGQIATWASIEMTKMGLQRIDNEAVGLSLTFIFERPKAHFGTGRNAHKIKGSAPDRHLKVPDLDKLIRAVNDGLTKVVYADDKQVDHIVAMKGWGPRAGVQITVRGESRALDSQRRQKTHQEGRYSSEAEEVGQDR